MFQNHSQAHAQQQHSQPQGTSLPPLLQPARLPELVMASTGHSERIEGAVEHVSLQESQTFSSNVFARL